MNVNNLKIEQSLVLFLIFIKQIFKAYHRLKSLFFCFSAPIKHNQTIDAFKVSKNEIQSCLKNQEKIKKKKDIAQKLYEFKNAKVKMRID